MIKATFKNIGPVRDANLELGDLTIIAGQNNTGKTYLVYTLYGFLRMWQESLPWFLQAGLPRRVHEKMKTIREHLQETGKAIVGLEQYRKIRKRIVKETSSLFASHLLGKMFSSPDGEFANACFSLSGLPSDLGLSSAEHGGEIAVDGGTRGKMRVKLSYSSDSPDKVLFSLANLDNVRISSADVEEGLTFLFLAATAGLLPRSFILSAERFGISLFYKELDFTKNRLVEELQNLSNEKRFDPFRFLAEQSARYAKPIKDNIDFTRSLADIQKHRGPLASSKPHTVDNMMGGRYKATRDDIRFISRRRKENRFDIPLHLASSSARGVSDLYFYRKHIARPGQLLIIDEPESHLSPGNQILMARLLVSCVNSGLKVLVTTHSDYFIKEINNLIMLHGDFAGKDQFLQKNKKDYTEDDHLDPDVVRAYTCRDGGLHHCEVDAAGIDMPVFDDAIDRINKVAMELSLLRTSE